MHLYSAQFSEDMDITNAPRVERTLLIASTPRSGSHMLGHAMMPTGLFGIPFEYLNPANLEKWRQDTGAGTGQEILSRMEARRTTLNGVFSLKAHYSHCREFGSADDLLSGLKNPYIVHIQRIDLMRQAISYAVAMQTGVWIAEQAPKREAARYDAEMITIALADLATQNSAWRTLFLRHDIPVMDVYYEDMVRDLSGTVTRIGHFMGVIAESETLVLEPRTRPQSSRKRTEDWLARYDRDRPKKRSLAARIKGKIKI